MNKSHNADTATAFFFFFLFQCDKKSYINFGLQMSPSIMDLEHCYYDFKIDFHILTHPG